MTRDRSAAQGTSGKSGPKIRRFIKGISEFREKQQLASPHLRPWQPPPMVSGLPRTHGAGTFMRDGGNSLVILPGSLPGRRFSVDEIH